MFIMREQANPTTAFDVIYDQAIGRVAGACMTLVSKALERSADDPEVRVRGFAVLGQIVAFRAARGAALRSLGWPDFHGERSEGRREGEGGVGKCSTGEWRVTATQQLR